MSNLLSFFGGVGKGFLEGVEKAEVNAKEEALLRVKRLTENYEKVKEENGKLSNNLKAEESWIKTYYPDATPEQVAYLQGSPDALQALKKMKDPTQISLSQVINIKAANEASSVVIEDIQNLPKVADAVGNKIKEAMPAYRRGIAGFYDEFGEQAGKTAEMRYARAMGVDVQTMEALKPMQRPTQAGTIDMAKISEASKGFTEQVDEAKNLMLNAQKSGDPKLIEAAKVVATSIKKTTDAFSDEEKQFAKTLDAAKNVLLTPDKFTPEEVKGANQVYTNYINMERRKALGTKVSDGKDAKDDTPKIGALNSFVSGAVAKELMSTFGKQVSEGKLTFTPNASGEVTANVLMTDMGERFKVASTQYEAAKRALSTYSDPKTGEPISNDGKAVLGQYKAALDRAREQYALTDAGKAELGAQQSTTPPPPAPPAAAAKPAAAATPAQSASPVKRPKPANAPADAKQADDGHWYSKNPQTGKYIKWSN